MQYRVIDVNSTQYKEDEQRLQSVRTMVVLWLFVLALGIVLIPLMLVAGWVRSDMTRLETELLLLQSTLNDATTPSAEVLEMGAEVDRIEMLISSIQTTTVPSGANWPQIVQGVSQYDPIAITLSSLTQIEDRVQLTGRATNNDAVVRYQQKLLDSGMFADVVVVSMVAVPPSLSDVEETESDKSTTAATPNSSVELGDVQFVIDLLLEVSAL